MKNGNSPGLFQSHLLSSQSKFLVTYDSCIISVVNMKRVQNYKALQFKSNNYLTCDIPDFLSPPSVMENRNKKPVKQTCFSCEKGFKDSIFWVFSLLQEKPSICGQSWGIYANSEKSSKLNSVYSSFKAMSDFRLDALIVFEIFLQYLTPK